MKHLIGLASLAILLFSSSCIKDELESNSRKVSINFVTNLSKDVTCDFYTSKADYDNATNIFKTVSFFKNSTQEVEGFPDDATYYYDCYSDDGTETNWLFPHIDDISFSTDDNSTRYEPIYCNSKTHHKNMLMPGKATSTKWKVVNALDRDRNKWVGDQMTAQEKSRTFIFKRDGTITYEYLNNLNEMKSIELFAKLDLKYYKGRYFTIGMHEQKNDTYPILTLEGPFSIANPSFNEEVSLTDTLIMSGQTVPYLILTRQ